MNKTDLIKLLRTSAGADSGCEKVFELLDQYVEAQLAGRDVESLFPDVAGHLQHCLPCREDRDALLALLREDLNP
jgi:hypothetical protein